MGSNQPNYAGRAENFAKQPPLQLTLRVMHRIFSNPRYWIGFGAVIAILTITGPFGTLNDLTFAPRLVYWGSISLVTFPLGMACSVFFGTYFYQLGTNEAVSRIIGGMIGGIPIGLFVWIVNKYFTGSSLGSFSDLIRLTGYTIVISTAVSVIYYLVESSLRPDEEENETSNGTAAVPFFKRLPVELGKDIISLQAQDHYVKVTTTKGSEMVLIRLADAEQELSGVSGNRVHRSWWVSDRHATALKRENSKLMLELSNGDLVPVSRSYSNAVRNIFDKK